jgi:hypothetical protein
MEWAFQELAHADMMETIERFEAPGQHDLVGVYDRSAMKM